MFQMKDEGLLTRFALVPKDDFSCSRSLGASWIFRLRLRDVFAKVATNVNFFNRYTYSMYVVCKKKVEKILKKMFKTNPKKMLKKVMTWFSVRAEGHCRCRSQSGRPVQQGQSCTAGDARSRGAWKAKRFEEIGRSLDLRVLITGQDFYKNGQIT